MTPEQLEAIEGIGPKTVEKISLAVNNYFASLEGGERVSAPATEGEERRAEQEKRRGRRGAETRSKPLKRPAKLEAEAEASGIETRRDEEAPENSRHEARGEEGTAGTRSDSDHAIGDQSKTSVQTLTP